MCPTGFQRVSDRLLCVRHKKINNVSKYQGTFGTFGISIKYYRINESPKYLIGKCSGFAIDEILEWKKDENKKWE